MDDIVSRQSSSTPENPINNCSPSTSICSESNSQSFLKRVGSKVINFITGKNNKRHHDEGDVVSNDCNSSEMANSSHSQEPSEKRMRRMPVSDLDICNTVESTSSGTRTVVIRDGSDSGIDGDRHEADDQIVVNMMTSRTRDDSLIFNHRASSSHSHPNHLQTPFTKQTTSTQTIPIKDTPLCSSTPYHSHKQTDHLTLSKKFTRKAYRLEEKRKYFQLLSSCLGSQYSTIKKDKSKSKFEPNQSKPTTSSFSSSSKLNISVPSLSSTISIEDDSPSIVRQSRETTWNKPYERNVSNVLRTSSHSNDPYRVDGVVTRHLGAEESQSLLDKINRAGIEPFRPAGASPLFSRLHSSQTRSEARLKDESVVGDKTTVPSFPSFDLPQSSQRFKEKTNENKEFFENKWFDDQRKQLRNKNVEDDEIAEEMESKLAIVREKRQVTLKSKRPYKPNDYDVNIRQYIKFEYNEIVQQEEEEEVEEEEDDQVSRELPILTEEMELKIEDALRPSPPSEVLSEGFSISIKRSDMETLAGLNWLNDEIVNFYLSLVVERGKNDNYHSCYAFNTFFWPKLRDQGHSALKRWTRKVDIFSYDFIFVPIHLGMHWCLAVVDFINKRIEYYDSMGGKNMECLQALKKYLEDESIDKKKTKYDTTNWVLKTVENIPQQMNGSDCGMFALKFAEYLSRRAKINFAQAHMPYFRRRMVYEILTQKLL